MDMELRFKDGECGERTLCYYDSGGDQIRISIENPPRTGSYFMVVSINGGDAVGLSCKEVLSFVSLILNEMSREATH